jgi:GNAT superfamily N-acetyltransferase
MTTTTVPVAFRVRAIMPDDREELTRFYAGLSTDSLEARFHGASPRLPDGTARTFCGPDHQHREGLVAVAPDADGRWHIIGHLCIEPFTYGEAEIAVAVAEGWRRQGVARSLLAQAIAWGQAHGIARLLGCTRWGNEALLALLRSTGRPVTFGAGDGGVLDARLDIRPVVPRVA